MTRSAPAASAASAVGVIRARTSSAASRVIFPRDTALSRIPAEYALPFSAASTATSFSTTSMPARAQT